ncbi:hypothetical protein BST61_g3065 [Cercospora zeina]
MMMTVRGFGNRNHQAANSEARWGTSGLFITRLSILPTTAAVMDCSWGGCVLQSRGSQFKPVRGNSPCVEAFCPPTIVGLTFLDLAPCCHTAFCPNPSYAYRDTIRSGLRDSVAWCLVSRIACGWGAAYEVKGWGLGSMIV